MKLAFIEKHKEIFPVNNMCKVFGLQRSSYYHWKRKPLSSKEIRDLHLLENIKSIHELSKERYGSPRVFEKMKEAGFKTSSKRVARLMRENGLRSKIAKKYRYMPIKDTETAVPNRLNRNFAVIEPDKVWTSDITYVRTWEGWLYVCVVLDLYSRKVVGWAMGKNMTSELVIKSVEMAFNNRKPKKGLLFHSDRGIQYASFCFQGYLAKHGFVQSLSRKGNCWDNAPTESFFKTLKVEELYFNNFRTRKEAQQIIFEYIECFYNRERLHSSLNYMSPEGFEKARLVA